MPEMLRPLVRRYRSRLVAVRWPGRWRIIVLTAVCLLARLVVKFLCKLDSGGCLLPCTFTLLPKSYMPRRYQGAPPPTDSVLRDVRVILVFAAAGYIVCFSKQCFMGAPQLQELSPRPPSPNVGALLAAALYGANVAYNVLNKRLLIAYPHPLLVTTMNFGTCSLFCIIAWVLGFQRPPPKLTYSMCARLAPLMFFHWMGTFLANISVSEVNIAFTHTVKAAEPVFTAVFATLLLGNSTSLRAWLYLMLVVAGVALASRTEVSFTWLGFWAAMASNISVSLRTVLSKKLIGNKTVPDLMSFMAVLHCGAFVMSLLAAACAKRPPVPDTFLGFSAKAASALAIGPLVWVFNTASILVLSWTSPVVHSMIRTLRRPVLVVASMVAFGTAVKPLNAGGIIMALVGAWLFNSPAGGGRPALGDGLLRELAGEPALSDRLLSFPAG
uniref:Sugar phosphate transporter domain-containing protein n=1 Tax=Pyrodinium bahamense TaxID=73915 RepID=A0A7R9ZY69_9DINO|mmetsp:Transcript_14755/g.40737  ORF Transcript_14755/g.40737 Transcript_14755/m.40737 type:complete len:441 (+) Transcript_14755:82-1404(+)